MNKTWVDYKEILDTANQKNKNGQQINGNKKDEIPKEKQKQE